MPHVGRRHPLPDRPIATKTETMSTSRRIGGAVLTAVVIVTLLLGGGSAQANDAGVPFTATFNGQIAFTSETMTTPAWSWPRPRRAHGQCRRLREHHRHRWGRKLPRRPVQHPSRHTDG